LISIGALALTIGATMYMHRISLGALTLLLGIINVVSIMAVWWRDVIREGTFEGKHTVRVQAGLKLGFALFIVSEVMFFFGFFWAFFHCALAPAIALGCTWPPAGINPFDPTGTPLVNTAVLLLSGATVTYTHRAMVAGKAGRVFAGFCETLFYALIFTLCQLHEYTHASFAINDSVFGSVFYMITGLHGCHVIVGAIFLFVCLIRFLNGHFSKQHHLGFVFSIWYWHFVDAVWIVVYSTLYVWTYGLPDNLI